ncbi:hypothetical protein ACFWAZ_39305 [Streptomyces collinus]|uniref:hypothetical protein n=1 Tax=Streptomyces collinus TaxID=42684 RepID=UPI003664870E
MTDLRLNDPGDGEGSSSPEEKVSAFKALVSDLFKKTGMSTSQFEDTYGYADGQVTKWQTHKNDKNIPPLRFLRDLISAVHERAHLQEGAPEAILDQYESVLRALVAKGNHQLYRLKLAEYESTILIGKLGEELGDRAHRVQHLENDLEAARKAMNAERASRLAAQLAAEQARMDTATADKAAAVARRDEVQRELALLEPTAPPVRMRTPAGSHTNRTAARPGLPRLGDVYAPPPLAQGPAPAPASGKLTPRFLLITVCATLAVIIIGLGAVRYGAGSDSPAKEASESGEQAPQKDAGPEDKGAEKGDGEPSKSPSASPTPVTSPPTPTPTESESDPVINQTITSFNFKSAMVDGAGINFDSDPPGPEGGYEDLETRSSEQGAVNINITLLEHKVVRLPSEYNATLENCRAAMVEPLGDEEIPVKPGDRVCFDTSERRIVYAKMTKVFPSEKYQASRVMVDGTVWTDPDTLESNN